ncbi:MAG: hypothetical protein ACM3H7_04945 [Acidobacteriaceae bacterium]
MKLRKSLPAFRLVFEILLIVGLLTVALPGSIRTQAVAQQEPDSTDALYWYQCNLSNHVAVFTTRVHIWCQSTTPVGGAPALTGISWFAFPTSPDSAGASRIFSILQSAKVTGGVVWVWVNPADTSGTSFGCGASDCRRIYGVELR